MHETQMRHEAMLRQLLGVERANDGAFFDIERPVESVDDLDEFDKRLDDVDLRKKVVCTFYIAGIWVTILSVLHELSGLENC